MLWKVPIATVRVAGGNAVGGDIQHEEVDDGPYSKRSASAALDSAAAHPAGSGPRRKERLTQQLEGQLLDGGLARQGAQGRRLRRVGGHGGRGAHGGGRGPHELQGLQVAEATAGGPALDVDLFPTLEALGGYGRKPAAMEPAGGLGPRRHELGHGGGHVRFGAVAVNGSLGQVQVGGDLGAGEGLGQV